MLSDGDPAPRRPLSVSVCFRRRRHRIRRSFPARHGAARPSEGNFGEKTIKPKSIPLLLSVGFLESFPIYQGLRIHNQSSAIIIYQAESRKLTGAARTDLSLSRKYLASKKGFKTDVTSLLDLCEIDPI